MTILILSDNIMDNMAFWIPALIEGILCIIILYPNYQLFKKIGQLLDMARHQKLYATADTGDTKKRFISIVIL